LAGAVTKSTSPVESAAAPSKNSYLLQRPQQQQPEEATQPTDPEKLTVHTHECAHSQVVQHDYHDHAADPTVDPTQIKHKAKGGVITPFPVKLHEMLDQIERDGLAHVVSWQPHGRCFVVHEAKEFVNHVMPKYFKQTKMASFQRQLNLYGFNRLTGGLDKGGYYHELFLRGKVSLAYDINRMRVKGTGVRLPTNPDNEPNFYALSPVTKSSVTMAPTSSDTSAPPLRSNSNEKPPAKKSSFNLAKRKAQLQRESQAHAKKISAAMGRQQRKVKKEEEDVVFFEGCPFHYLDPSALAPVPPQALADAFMPPLPKEEPLAQEPKSFNKFMYHHSNSTVVSDSEDDNDAIIPSFSAASMDWEGPLSSPTLQAHMRRSSFQSFNDSKPAASNTPQRRLDDDIETFFSRFDMPVDEYHEQIEQMVENDDTAFGYLLEQAISE
jgi:hypothetical protein